MDDALGAAKRADLDVAADPDPVRALGRRRRQDPAEPDQRPAAGVDGRRADRRPRRPRRPLHPGIRRLLQGRLLQLERHQGREEAAVPLLRDGQRSHRQQIQAGRFQGLHPDALMFIAETLRHGQKSRRSDSATASETVT